MTRFKIDAEFEVDMSKGLMVDDSLLRQGIHSAIRPTPSEVRVVMISRADLSKWTTPVLLVLAFGFGVLIGMMLL